MRTLCWNVQRSRNMPVGRIPDQAPGTSKFDPASTRDQTHQRITTAGPNSSVQQMHADRKETVGLIPSTYPDKCLQPLGSRLRQVDKMDTHLKQVLRQSLGMNNTCTGFY